MTLRTMHLVGVRRHNTGAEDAHGNPIEGHGEPEDLLVYAIAPSTSDEPQAGRNLVVTGYTLLAPPGTDIDPLDLIVIDGEDYKVVGDYGDWTRGPFGYRPGVSISVQRAEGTTYGT